MRITTGMYFSLRMQSAFFPTFSFPACIKHEGIWTEDELDRRGSVVNIVLMSSQHSR